MQTLRILLAKCVPFCRRHIDESEIHTKVLIIYQDSRRLVQIEGNFCAKGLQAK